MAVKKKVTPEKSSKVQKVEKKGKRDPISERRLDQVLKNDMVKVDLGEIKIPLEGDAISATIHEGLMDYRIMGTHLRLLGMVDPTQTPTTAQRVAMAKRLIEVGPFLPRYIKAVELTSHRALPPEEVQESQELSIIHQERQKKSDIVNGVGKVFESPTESKTHKKRVKERMEGGKTSNAPAAPKGEAIPDGIPLKKLCALVDIDPRDARRCLRAKKIEKPGGRWEWTKERSEEIKVILIAERDAILASKL